jgi:hypothetical protein
MEMSEPDPDLLGSLIERARETTSDRLDRRMREAHEIKAQEEASSQSRLEKMWTREHERQRAITDSEVEQRHQEQMLVRYVLVGAAAVILIIIVLTVALSLSGEKSTPESLIPLLTAHA